MPPAIRHAQKDLRAQEPPAVPVAISVVVPIFNERECLPELRVRLGDSLSQLGVDYEIIFVNDGSTDGSEELLNGIAEADETVTVLHFSRNFGHQPAVTAGLERASGDAVIVLDGDLQDPPEVIPQLIERWREGFDVVCAIRTKRKESFVRRIGYNLFYRLLRGLSRFEIPLDSGDFCLIDRRALDAMNRLPEKDRFVRGLRSFIGFRQIGVPYERAVRSAGESKYSFAKLLELAVTGLVNTGEVPIRAMLGTVLALFGIAFAVTAVWAGRWALAGIEPSGWMVVASVLILLSAIQIAAMGLLGMFVVKIFAEVKKRPPYILREVRRREAATAAMYSRIA